MNSLGEKSLAGLIAKPQLKPKQIPIARIVRPMKNGTNCLDTCMFLLSVMAQTQMRRKAVAITWSRIPPMLVRCWEGKVENILAVSGVDLYSPLSCSYLVYTVDNDEYQLSTHHTRASQYTRNTTAEDAKDPRYWPSR